MISPACITEWSQQCPWVSPAQVEQDLVLSSTGFALNLAAKIKHAGFLSDTPPLLRPGIHYNPTDAYDWLTAELIPLIP